MNPDLEKRLDDLVLTKPGVCIILYKGKQLQMPSGKSVWTAPRHAKSAWSNAFGNRAAKYYGYKDAKALRDDLISKGLLYFKVL